MGATGCGIARAGAHAPRAAARALAEAGPRHLSDQLAAARARRNGGPRVRIWYVRAGAAAAGFLLRSSNDGGRSRQAGRRHHHALAMVATWIPKRGVR